MNMGFVIILLSIIWFITFLFWDIERTKRKVYQENLKNKDDLINTLKCYIDDYNKKIGELEMKIKHKIK